MGVGVRLSIKNDCPCMRRIEPTHSQAGRAQACVNASKARGLMVSCINPPAHARTAAPLASNSHKAWLPMSTKYLSLLL